MKTNYKNILIAISILVIGILIGWVIFAQPQSNEEVSASEIQEDRIWTCSMHPQIKKNEPGDCPICGMDLIPMDQMEDNLDPNSFKMSDNAIKLANIQTTVVGQKDLQHEIRLNGKVELNERNSYTQSTHIPGRIEDLYINFTGEKVRRGQKLATVYSPELVTAQEELLQASKMQKTQPTLLDAAKEKLKRWKITNSQIDQILETGKPLEKFPIQADISGVVTEKKVEIGDYIEKGSALYEISDLSTLWIMFDLYEDDLNWVKKGDKISYSVKGIPGEKFEGVISFIDPLLDAQTRVASARVEISNREAKLKPEMFVSGLVMAEQKSNQNEIIAPKSAVLWTGTRSVVYVKDEDEFKLRMVTLGPSLGDHYVIKKGLSTGEEIVTNGTFTLDAAVQLSGKASMMNPGRGSEEPIELSSSAKNEIKALYDLYFELKNSLTEDDFTTAIGRAKELKASFHNIKMGVFSGDSHDRWMDFHAKMKKILENIGEHQDIESLRKNFIALSDWMIEVTETFQPLSEEVYLLHCPMADNDQGADWLSREDQVVNPYFGESMLRCGEVKKSFN